MVSRKEFLTGLGLGGASALATAALFAKTAAAQTELECEPPPAEFVSVLDYGAERECATDNAPAINDALSSGAHVYFPPGSYRVDSPLVIETPGQMLFSDAAYGAVAPTILSSVSGGEATIRVEASQAVLHGLKLEGPIPNPPTDPNPVSLAIRCRKTLNSDDIDFTLHNCQINNFTRGVAIYGRGLRVSNCVFYSIDDVIIQEWQASGFDGSGDPFGLQPLPYGMRALHVHDNRVHSCHTFIVNDGNEAGNLWGMMLANNLLDVGNSLFRGAASYSAIVGNVVCHAADGSNTDAVIAFTVGCRNTLISGNVISGHDQLSSKQPYGGISFAGFCDNVTITGNAFSNIQRNALTFNALGQKYVTVSGNSFSRVGLDQNANRGCLKFDRDASSFAVVGNSFNLDGLAKSYCMHGSNKVFSNFQFQSNVHGSTANLYYNVPPGTNNNYQA